VIIAPGGGPFLLKFDSFQEVIFDYALLSSLAGGQNISNDVVDAVVQVPTKRHEELSTLLAVNLVPLHESLQMSRSSCSEFAGLYTSSTSFNLHTPDQ
jgi:hypothetical protein